MLGSIYGVSKYSAVKARVDVEVADIPSRLHEDPLPMGNTNAALPIFFMGPFTNEAAEPAVDVAAAFKVNKLEEEVFIIPIVSVNEVVIATGLARFNPDEL